MSVFVKSNDEWQDAPTLPQEGAAIELRAEPDVPPEVRFHADGASFFRLRAADAPAATEMIHTVAGVDLSRQTNSLLFALYVNDRDVSLDDLRPEDHDPAYSDEKLDEVEAALDEILVPIYVDDVVSDLSEGLPGLVVLLTTRKESGSPGWTYARMSAFDDGTLAIEEEYGEL